MTTALAKILFEEALAIDPEFVSAISFLGQTYLMNGLYGWTLAPREESLAIAMAHYDRALEIRPAHAGTFAAMAFFYDTTQQIEQALEFGQRAMELDPNDFQTHGIFGLGLVYAGRPLDATKELRLSQRLSPVTPRWVDHHLLRALVDSGQYEEALRRPKDNLASWRPLGMVPGP